MMKKTIQILSVFILAVFMGMTGYSQGTQAQSSEKAANGTAESENSSPTAASSEDIASASVSSEDVALEIVRHTISEYASFDLKFTNTSEQTVYILKYGLNYNVPDFYSLDIQPKYEFSEEMISMAMPKPSSYFLKIDPGNSVVFNLTLESGILPQDKSLVGKSVNMVIRYEYSREEDLAKALDWYGDEPSMWDPDAALREDVEPLMNRLTSLKLESPAIRVKIPKE